MKTSVIKTIKFLSFLFAGLALLYFAFNNIDLAEMLSDIRQADYRWVGFSALLCVLAIVFRTFRWQLLIELLGEKPKKMNIFHAINTGYLANFSFPRIGEIARCAALNKTDKIPVDKLIGTVVIERLFDLIMTALMLCLILILRYQMVSAFINEHIIQPIGQSENILTIVVVTVLILATIYIIYRILKKLFKEKIQSLLSGVTEGVKTVTRLKKIRLFVLLNFLIFGMYFLQSYVLFFALDCTSSLGLSDALFVLVLSSLAFIVPVPAGIGAYHGIVAMGLTILGLTYAQGIVYATISHSVTSIVLIILGTISVLFVLFKK